MADPESIEQATNPFAKQILIISSLLLILVMFTYYIPSLVGMRVPLAYLVQLTLIYCIYLATRIYRAANDPLPALPFITGSGFAAGGAALDGIATLIKSPTLAREANPIARALLDSGHSVTFVIFYGVFAQIIFVALGAILWAGFLRHKKTFLALVHAKKPGTRLEFIKAAMGGAHLTWRQLFLPFTLKEFPTSYYILWILPVGFVGGSLYRWYLGFSWLGLMSIPRLWVLIISISLTCVCYYAWLWFEASKPLANQPGYSTTVGRGHG